MKCCCKITGNTRVNVHLDASDVPIKHYVSFYSPGNRADQKVHLRVMINPLK